jgi:DNA-binding response OmpR family regulator
VARILVIDDEVEARDAVAEVLSQASHEVLTAEHGGTGLDLYRRHGADLVITDVLMPEKDGLETIREMFQMDPGAKIIAVSGAGTLLLSMAGGLGAQRTLMKPFTPADLLRAVGEMLTA